jgi:hypothetical protein
VRESRSCRGSSCSISTTAWTPASLPANPEIVAVAAAKPPESGIGTAAPAEANAKGESATAASVSMRGVRTPLRGSKTGFPVARRRLAICPGESSGRACCRSATAPATAGAAAEVPWNCSTAPPRVGASQRAPGASSESCSAELEKQTTVSAATAGSAQRVPPESFPHAMLVELSG